jgi:hypothetical protein
MLLNCTVLTAEVIKYRTRLKYDDEWGTSKDLKEGGGGRPKDNLSSFV